MLSDKLLAENSHSRVLLNSSLVNTQLHTYVIKLTWFLHFTKTWLIS